MRKTITNIYFEKSFTDKLREYAKAKDLKQFIKTFIDWIIENDLDTDVFDLRNTWYDIDGQSTLINFEDEICDWNECYNFTEMSDYDFITKVLWDESNKRLYSYRGFLIYPSYSTTWTHDAGGYYVYNKPKFFIFPRKDIEAIEEQ